MNAIRFLFLPNQCQGRPLLKAASQHPRARLSDPPLPHHFPVGLHDAHCAHSLVEKVSRSKNAAEISVPFPGPKSAAAQMLKFTNPRRQHTHTHTRHQGGQGGRRLPPGSLCHRGCRCNIPHSGNADPSRRDFAPPYCSGVFSLRDRGLPQHPRKSLQPTAASLPLWASMGWTERNPVGLPVQLDTQHAPRPLQTPPAEPGAAVPTFRDRVRGVLSARWGARPQRAPLGCQARDPLRYAKTWHLQPGAGQAVRGDKDRSVIKVRPRALTHAVFLVLRRYPHGYKGR